MSSNPLVSVIIPTYGRREYLEESIASVLNQTYPDIELIVVDDFSPAPVLVATGHAGDMRVLRHARNMGPGAARNTGLSHAQGRYVAFLDDDDLLPEDRIERAVDGLGSARMHAAPSNQHARVFQGDMRRTLHHGTPPAIAQVVFHREDVLHFDPALRVGKTGIGGFECRIGRSSPGRLNRDYGSANAGNSSGSQPGRQVQVPRDRRAQARTRS